MPSELGLLSEGLCYLGLSRDYSLQSSLSPAPLWLCAHTGAPSLELADNSEPQFSGYYQTFTSSLCTFCIMLSVSQKELSPCAVLGEHLGRGCAVGWAAAVGSIRGAQCSTAVSHCCFGNNNCREDSWGVSCQSCICVLSYSSLAAFLSL